jgi:hypothetical protein
MKIPSLILLLGWLAAGSVQAEITLRVSVKFILSSSGNRPPATYVDDNGKTKNSAIDTDAKVQAYIDYANEMLIKHRRGYRMALLPIQEVSGHSEWFNMDATGEVGDLETAVIASLLFDGNEFLFDTSAINIYIVNGQTAGACACGNPESTDIIALSQSINPDWVILHESGHYLGLPHTQDGEQFLFAPGVGCKMSGTKDNCDCPIVIPGNDGIADTLPDVSCWSIDDLSQNAFGGNFASLTASQQLKVSNTFSNIMAYHGSKPGSRNVLTSDQLDVMADYANSIRDNVANGITWFVDRDNSSGAPLGNSKSILGIGGPFPKVEQGIAVARANDIVLVRPGTYTDTTLLNKALTLRATRGNATLRASP